MANIHNFPEANMVWKGWPGTKDKPKVLDMPAYRDKAQSISCWKLSFKERLKALFTGRIWLYVLGGDQPPVYITSDWPFKRFVKDD